MAMGLHSRVKVVATMPRQLRFGKGKAVAYYGADAFGLPLARMAELR
jgi:hypothetical protein